MYYIAKIENEYIASDTKGSIELTGYQYYAKLFNNKKEAYSYAYKYFHIKSNDIFLSVLKVEKEKIKELLIDLINDIIKRKNINFSKKDITNMLYECNELMQALYL